MTVTKKVLLAGASGQTGQQVLHQLNRTDIEVRALTRSDANTDQLQQGTDEVMIGNLLNRDDTRTAVTSVHTHSGPIITYEHRTEERVR